jgi:hypothetical protein
LRHSALKAPFPYFGGKARVAPVVWQALGTVENYVEPFFGSGAVLLARPQVEGLETVNDKCGFISNFWRAVQHDPAAVAHYADYPVLENCLHARHAWLVGQAQALVARLEGDPDYYDAKSAGWWVWGMALWIGSGFCSGDGPWQVQEGRLVRAEANGSGIHRQRVHLGHAGKGVKRQRVHLGHGGQGVQRLAVHEPPGGPAGTGAQGLLAWMQALAERLRRVRVCCGDWTRVLGPTPTVHQGLTGVFLDPPYPHRERDRTLYRVEEDVAAAVTAWAVAHGDDPRLRIVLCGYTDTGAMPATWRAVPWTAPGGYGLLGNGRGRTNAGRECLWLSPHCLAAASSAQLALF